jgi:cyclophilin family peptidyl-prolyl cis-trans isomerase
MSNSETKPTPSDSDQRQIHFKQSRKENLIDATKPHRDVAFISTWADALLVGGISILVYFVFGFSRIWGVEASWAGQNGNQIAQFALWASALSWVINYPHFSATIWRLYARRETRQEFKWTTWWSPVVAISGLFMCYLDPQFMAPIWAKFFILWSGYHFSAQSLGFALLYLRRDRFEITQAERVALGLLVFAPYFGSSIMGETAERGANYFSLIFPTMGLPVIYQSLAQVLVYAALLIGVIGMVRAMDRRERWPHFLVFVPIVAQWVWFWLGKQSPEFNYFVPAFHSLQYLAIAAYMRGVELQDEELYKEELGSRKKHSEQRPVGILSKYSWSIRTLGWYAYNIAGGAALFWFFPQSLRKLGEWIAPGTLYAQEGWVIPVVLATVQIHHFFVDGVIWKLRHASVRKALMRPQQLLSSARGLSSIVAMLLVGNLLFAPGALATQDKRDRVTQLDSVQALGVSPRGASRVLDPEHDRQKLAAERVLLRTDFGDLVLGFYPEVAPRHVARILELARQKAWVGLEFPRLVPGFVLQIQELPESKEAARAPHLQPLNAEFSHLPHVRGVLSMARNPSDTNSARTSWSILLGTAPHLDREFTIFGRIDRGGRVLELIEGLAAQAEDSKPWYRIVVRDMRILKSGKDGESLLPENFQEARLPAELITQFKSKLKGKLDQPQQLAHRVSWTMLMLLMSFLLALLALNPPEGLRRAETSQSHRCKGILRYLRGLSILLLAFGIVTLAYQFKWQETWSAGVVGGLSLMAIWLGFRSVSGLELSQGQSEDPGQDSSSRDAGGKV